MTADNNTKPTGRAEKELTPAFIASMKPKVDGDGKLKAREVGDLKTPGLRLRCGASGKKVFVYRYKAASGLNKEIKLGEFPPSGSMTLADARKALAKAKTERESGIDPQGEKRARLTEAKAEHAKQKVQAYSVGLMLDDYLVGYIVENRKAKGANDATRLLNSDDLKTIRKRPAVEVTRNEAVNLIETIRNRGVPITAGKIKAELKAAYEYALNGEVFDVRNPFAFKTPKGVTAGARTRVLNKAELIALIPWMRREYSEAVADALLLTLYCGVRSGEVCEVEAHEVEDGEDGMVWTIPTHKSKTVVLHNVMVPRQVAPILRKRLMMFPDGFLFPAKAKAKPISQKVLGVAVWRHSPTCAHPYHKNKSKCPVADWAPHDLRRTCRTELARMGCPDDVGEAVLNHVKVGVRKNYNQYTYDDEKRDWLQRWADHLDTLTSDNNVVPFDQRKTG